MHATFVRHLVVSALALALLSTCGEDSVRGIPNGHLRVTAKGVNVNAANVRVALQLGTTNREEGSDAATSGAATVVNVRELAEGHWAARVASYDAANEPLQSIWIDDVEILRDYTTELTVDLIPGTPAPGEICDGKDNDGDQKIDEPLDLAICAQCVGGLERVATDDERCGTLSCAAFDTHELRGSTTAVGDKSCVRVHHPDLTDRCAYIGQCLHADATHCTKTEEQVALTAGTCKLITGCETGAPKVVNAPDGDPCGGENTCSGGECKAPVVPPSNGCADGTREGFQSLTDYPSIAACSGAWSVGGVTRANLAATCNRASGNDGTNKEGTGCSAADVCAAGWHVCRGKAEVGAKAPAGCGAAVPAGTPDKAYFFAVAQPSELNTTCDGAAGDNDVFGCGNLGVQLQADRNCGPLNRALASTRANSCGFNEAEPNLGPWQCLGDAQSHYHEGAIVTKQGCPNGSCSYDGHTVGNADKGGVLCCRD